MRLAALERAAARFNRMTVRERVIVSVASLAAVLMLWTLLVFDPQAARESTLRAELTTLETSIGAASDALASDAASNPAVLARNEERNLKAQLEELNKELAAESSGLIAPERMVQVVHDVLTRQRGVRLISLHNKPVASLAPPTNGAAPSAGPYLHPIELVIEGRYLDVAAYLRALEKLPWRFYWKVLELETKQHPISRVRIEMSTLSLEREWIGV